MGLASPANPFLRRFGITAAVIGALMVIAPPVVRWLRTPDVIPPGTLSVSPSTTQSLRYGKSKRTWRIRAGGDMIWQAVGMPQLLPISRMGRDHPNGSNHSMNVDLALADLGDGRVRVTQTINGHSASADAVAKIEDLIREAGPDAGRSGRVLPLANLSVAPLVLARIDDESMLPNEAIGIADPVPRPASNLYLHVWQTAPGPGRLVLTRQIFTNVAGEDIQENELLGRLEARRGSDGNLTYTARFHSLGNQIGRYEGPLELDRPVICETLTEVRCGYAVLTTNPVADQQQFPPIERWRYSAKHLTPARIEFGKKSPGQRNARSEEVALAQDERGAFTLTGPLEKVRPAMTMLRLIDQPEVEDPAQLPLLNMPPEFFLRIALPKLMFGNDFTKAPLTDALRGSLQNGITPAQFSRALAGHVFEIDKAVVKDLGPPFDSIKTTPGVSTFYDVAIPCLDLYDGSGIPTKELTFRIERTVEQVGARSKIASIAPWLIEEAKKLPATPLLEK